jgi:hypothetical protein
MRPAGVQQRIQQLREREDEHALTHPQQALRRSLTWFIHGCALLAFDDLGASAVVEAYRNVLVQLDDLTQQRTGSRLERLSLDCVSQLRGPLAEVAAEPHRHAARDDEIAGPVLLRIPPRTLIGRETRDAYFPMACFNAAGSCLDGIISPYQAAGLITTVGYFEPDEERDLLASMRALSTRYEDQLHDRDATADEIAQHLHAWLQNAAGQ